MSSVETEADILDEIKQVEEEVKKAEVDQGTKFDSSRGVFVISDDGKVLKKVLHEAPAQAAQPIPMSRVFGLSALFRYRSLEVSAVFLLSQHGRKDDGRSGLYLLHA